MIHFIGTAGVLTIHPNTF